MIIRNTKQYETPVQLPSVAKAGVRMTHNASARTVKVTKRTMGMVNDVGVESALR
jgi:spartin